MAAFFRSIGMRLYYEDVDITDQVQIASAVVRDVSCGRADSLELVVNNAAAWYAWQPAGNDRIRVTQDGYDSGDMYLNAIAPEEDSYRIIASGARNEAKWLSNKSFEGMTLQEIMNYNAAECRMGVTIFGIDEKTKYDYLIRQNEGCAAFLNRLAEMEGAVLKTYSGKFTMIGIHEAQKLPAMETVFLTDEQPGFYYERKENTKYRSVTIKTPFTNVTATDRSAPEGKNKTICSLPATDNVTAGRWASGLLLSMNRKAECAYLQTEFRPNWTAMRRIDIAGNTTANGQWIIDETEHDLINMTSTAVLYRCVEL